MTGFRVPDITFHTRQNSEWVDVTTNDLFDGKRVVLFALPGAFTPTCSTYQLPGYEEKYEEFKELGIDEVYCLSVNDSFVMNAWFESLGIEKVKPIPDGNGEFSKTIDSLVEKNNLGFGLRSWRYAAVINDGEVEMIFGEEGKRDNADDDPYTASSPSAVLLWLKTNDAAS